MFTQRHLKESCFNGYLYYVIRSKLYIYLYVQKLGQLLAEFVQTFRPAAKMVSIAGLSSVSCFTCLC